MSRLSAVPFRSILSRVCAAKPSARTLQPRRLYSRNDNDTHSSGDHTFRNERRPTDFDKKVLVWSGRYKKQEDIPEFVSYEAIAAARSNFRIKLSMAMILFTVVGCIFMVRSGKQALKEDNTLLQKNIERKAKWREEAEQERKADPKSH